LKKDEGNPAALGHFITHGQLLLGLYSHGQFLLPAGALIQFILNKGKP